MCDGSNLRDASERPSLKIFKPQAKVLNTCNAVALHVAARVALQTLASDEERAGGLWVELTVLRSVKSQLSTRE